MQLDLGLSSPDGTWLEELTAETLLTVEFPIQAILKDSLYYPASGFDGDPIKHLLGTFMSYIYVDYARSHELLMQEIRGRGFKGYRMLGWRAVTRSELVPHGWTPQYPTRADGNPRSGYCWAKPPFCDWLVFELLPEMPKDYGPSRFSLLFVGGDGVATFQALYLGNHAFPRGVAIIQDGYGFGFNWTSFRDRSRIFARSVMESPYGQPEVLLNGGWSDLSAYKDPIWPEYTKQLIQFRKTRGGAYVAWRRSS
jgi:hypothetical protein